MTNNNIKNRTQRQTWPLNKIYHDSQLIVIEEIHLQKWALYLSIEP